MKPNEEEAPSQVAWDSSDARTLYANAFHAASDREEVALLFGQWVPAPRDPSEKRLEFQEKIVLNPFAAKRFAMRLQNAVRTYELTYGPLDKEPLAIEPTACHGSGLIDERAHLLLDLVGKLEVVYGLERSFKVLDKTLLGNRFLVTMTKDSIGKQSNQRLLDICSQIGMPGDLQGIYRENLSFAKYIHFGFEENEKSAIYKAYLEFPPRWEVELLNKPAGADSYTLYLGFKWDASENRKRALTRYTCYPRIPLEKILDRLSNLYEGSRQRDSLEITKEILETALSRIGYDKVLYLEVSEDNNPRRSFDINIYRAKLRLEQFHPLFMRICRHFSISPERFHALYDPVRSKRLGHLSGGIDREGKDFLTVYYGVEGNPGEALLQSPDCAEQERS
jgi:hypothetical protein